MHKIKRTITFGQDGRGRATTKHALTSAEMVTKKMMWITIRVVCWQCYKFHLNDLTSGQADITIEIEQADTE